MPAHPREFTLSIGHLRYLLVQVQRQCLAVITASLLALLSLSAQAQNPADAAMTKRATDLREAPGDNARSLAQLPGQTVVTRLAERSGPWIKVQVAPTAASAAAANGWIHMFDLTTAASNTSGGSAASGFLRGVSGLFHKGGSQGTQVATSTVGIRGLGAEDLANAQPNMAGVDQMEAQRIDTQGARQFAQAAGLVAVKVDTLPAGNVAPASSGGGRSGESGQ